MILEIITPEKNVFSGEIDEVTVPTPKGLISILPHHINLVTKLESGEIVIKIKGKERYLGITGGFLEVNNNQISILSDYAIHSEDIEVQKAVLAQKRAEEILKRSKESVSERDLAAAQGDLRRSVLQLHIANKRRRRVIPQM